MTWRVTYILGGIPFSITFDSEKDAKDFSREFNGKIEEVKPR